jgi:tol-pal system protein YbgF
MKSYSYRLRATVLAVFAALLLAAPALAQERNGNFLDNLFSRGEPQQQQQQPPQGGQSQVEYRRGGDQAQADPGDVSVRIDRIEGALRQLTGTIEQLQYQNQQLQDRLKRMQDDTDYRFQQMGGRPGAPPPAGLGPPPSQQQVPGRRGDVFDPNQQPNAPGAPRALGNQTALATPQAMSPQQPMSQQPPAMNEPPVGAPGGREAGAPLDLNAASGNPLPPVVTDSQAQQNPQPVSQPQGQLPPAVQPPRGPVQPAVPNTQMATLPPSASPQDEYDMAYGYVLHKDYGLAEQAFRDFLRKYPNERLVPDAQYWLGESLFQRQRYRDAAESFLAVSTKYEHAGKAPDALLRLGQSLAGLNQKEAACATLAEVGRKFPHASATVKRGVTAEQKRVHC